MKICMGLLSRAALEKSMKELALTVQSLVPRLLLRAVPRRNQRRLLRSFGTNRGQCQVLLCRAGRHKGFPALTLRLCRLLCRVASVLERFMR